MKLRKSFNHAWEMLIHSKLRSWLTILGIVIGVASVIAIVSMGAGMQQEVNSQLGDLGGDIITISSGFSRAGGFGGMRMPGDRGGATASDEDPTLERIDLQAVKSVGGLLAVDTRISGRVEVYYLGKKGSVSITGVEPGAWVQINTEDLAAGRFLGPSDSNVVLIGGRLANTYFDSPVGLNQMITIEDRSFRVVGILDNQGTEIIMPLVAAYQVIEDQEKDEYGSFVVKVKDESQLDAIVEALDYKLMIVRHVTANNKDYTVSSSKEQMETRAEITNSMTMFLTAIAAVALIVGAVGIANTMFTSVLEKTKEIGIMKAIGARNNEIMILFLLNSGLLGLIGGLIGVIFGAMLSAVMPVLMGTSGGIMSRMASGSVVSINSIIIALLLSLIIGMISGAIPAYKASKLKPVDALRYE
jgi:putative ABC transport system permease protein